jgi:DNA-binding protein H-NS
MARGKKVMADEDETQDVDDLEEGKLPPSFLTKPGKDADFDAMTPDEIMAVIEQAIDYLPASNLKAVRDLAEERRLEKLEDTKHDLLEEMREKAEAFGMSLADLFPQAFSAGRKPRSDTGQPLPAKYLSPTGQPWSGRGHPPRWLTDLEAQGHHRDEFKVTDG